MKFLNWLERKLENKPTLVGAVFFMVVVFGAIFGFVVMLLWNALMPELFNLSEVSFWQALGLLVLSSLLFRSSQSWRRE